MNCNTNGSIDNVVDPSVVIKHPDSFKIGSHNAIDHGFYCTTQLEIGNYVHIGPYVCVIGGKDAKLIIEDFATIAAGSKIICCSTDVKGGIGLVGPASIPPEYRSSRKNEPVTLKRFSVVAVNSVVFPGVTLAEGTVIGPNSLIRKDTAPWTIYVGTPAKEFGARDPGKKYEYAKILGL